MIATTTATAPATTTEQQYEHRQAPSDRSLIQVRPVYARLAGERGASWHTYMYCRDECDALRILWLINTSSAEVLP